MLFTDVSEERASRALLKAGFVIKREGKHTVMNKGEIIITIPRHNRLNPYTLENIIRDAELTDDEFKKLL